VAELPIFQQQESLQGEQVMMKLTVGDQVVQKAVVH
jgi:hypothetical protein